jgi:hypothetical protein
MGALAEPPCRPGSAGGRNAGGPDALAAPADHADQDPLAILRERYARGEVGHEEFERILDGLLRTEGATPGALRNGDPR